MGPCNVQIFTLPLTSSPSSPPRHHQTLPFVHPVWEASVFNRSTFGASFCGIFPRVSEASKTNELYFLISYRSVVFLYTRGYNTPPIPGSPIPEGYALQSHSHYDWDRDWRKTSWGFLVGVTVCRIMRLSKGYGRGDLNLLLLLLP